MSPVSATSTPSSRPLSPAPQQTFQQQQSQQPLFPEPIIFQYVLYYPGNLPLVITAGHGGSALPGEVLSRKRTHRLRRIPDLATVTEPIEISSFAEPLYPSCSSSTSQTDPTTGAVMMNANLNNCGGDETMPLMAPRDQTKGGNFKKDLNTHSIALNLANAISCLTSGVGNGGGGAGSGPGGAIVSTTDGTLSGGPFSSRTRATAARNGNGNGEGGSEDVTHIEVPSSVTSTPTTDHGTNNAIPARCEQQGSWGDDDSDYPFPVWTSTSLAPTPTPTPTIPPGVHQHQQQQQDPTRRLHQKQAQNYPHVIVFRIPRQFVDVNRNITGENAIAEGDAHAEAAWREYHDLIDHVQKMSLQKATFSISQHQEQEQQERKGPRQQSHWTPPLSPVLGRGLLLDIHGHAHASNLIEIGYLLNGTVLNMDDDRLNAYASRLTKESSMRSLINKVVSPSTSSSSSASTSGPVTDFSAMLQQGMQFSKLIRGGRTESLGGMLQAQGLNAVPSPEFQAPCQECIYFFGGYTIQRHGSRDHHHYHKDSALANNDTMDAIQLELPKILRLVDKEQGREVGMKLGRAVVDFVAQYYGLFRETPAVVAREQPDAVVMAAMAKGVLSSRSGASTPRRSSGRGGGGRIGVAGSNGSGGRGGGGAAGQMVHSMRLQERLARVHHSHNRIQQQQHSHHHQHHPQQQQQHEAGADPSVSIASCSSSNNPSSSDGWDQQSGDSHQSGDSEMENEREKCESGSSARRPEIKRQASRL
ncbi:MAG: hypothetical protein J3R72DRAFT_423035 [Linnemannia gamsii]|nr:MAG: hypothetical protein J3R72DRAFT_423035 [Linnemannia gamsii]